MSSYLGSIDFLVLISQGPIRVLSWVPMPSGLG